jgi:beta-lactamase superfamily II metal-dependent hydrolase
MSNAEDIQVNLVHVEFLRKGPPHNQLLSPLTSYLAISGTAGAGVVTIPYEHAEFQRRLKELRYETGDPGDRQAMLHDMGAEMGRILGSVPGVPGALSDQNQTGTLIHLRITLSASELALLPFEVARVPVSATDSGESWLSIQTRPPVCVTRNVRSVSPEGVVWPDKPRILFIAGDPDDVPYKDHRDVLLRAIQPFRYPRYDDPSYSQDHMREQFGDLLTILVNPTLTQVLKECRTVRYSHVHVLAHGGLSETSREAFGIRLREDDGSAGVVSGDQFADALTSVGDDRIHRPTVVTLASCDSANQGDVVIPGASFAHALHQSGIPLVVASQFPLSKEGSVPFVENLYEGLLWGKNPLVLLQRLRAELHARYTSRWHDWASVVVYEALPQSWFEQLDTLRYSQSKRAMNAVLERIDIAVQKTVENSQPESLERLEEDLQRAVDRLPLNGHYGVECLGLRASSLKRRARAAFTLSGAKSPRYLQRSRDQYELLDKALHDYEQAARGLLLNDAHAVQRVATLHWVLVQVVSLSAVLGREVDDSRWKAAMLCAELYRDSVIVEDRAWAHGSIAELCLVRLAMPNLSHKEKKEYSKTALQHAQTLSRFYPWDDEFPIKSTRRQFERYLDWWGTPEFEKVVANKTFRAQGAWAGTFGVLATAKRLIAVLHRKTPQPNQSFPTVSKSSGSPDSSSGESDKSAQAKKDSLTGSSAQISSASLRAKRTSKETRRSRFFDVEMLPAGNGDSIWIEYGDNRSTHRLLIDCGTNQTAKELARRVESLSERERSFELFVMSHIDSDHIGGALPFLKTIRNGLKFGDVWFNGWRHLSGQLGARQGEIFSTAIEDFKLPWNGRFKGAAIVVDGSELPEIVLPSGMKLTLLSPTREQLRKLAPAWTREMKRYGLEPGSRVDYSRFLKGTPSPSTDVEQLADTPFAGDAGLPNGSSIAMLAEFDGASVLLGADAHAPVLVTAIRKLLKERQADRLTIDAFKVSHHASKNNLSAELLQLLKCQRYLISTNGDHFSHPDREAIARIIKYGGDRPTLYFNYRSETNKIWERPDLQEKYRYLTYYPESGVGGIKLPLLSMDT